MGPRKNPRIGMPTAMLANPPTLKMNRLTKASRVSSFLVMFMPKFLNPHDDSVKEKYDSDNRDRKGGDQSRGTQGHASCHSHRPDGLGGEMHMAFFLLIGVRFRM